MIEQNRLTSIDKDTKFRLNAIMLTEMLNLYQTIKADTPERREMWLQLLRSIQRKCTARVLDKALIGRSRPFEPFGVAKR